MKLVDLIDLFEEDQSDHYEVILWDGTNRRALQVDGIDHKENRIVLTTTDFYDAKPSEEARSETPYFIIQVLQEYLDNVGIDVNTRHAEDIDDLNEPMYSATELERLEKIRYWVYGDGVEDEDIRNH